MFTVNKGSSLTFRLGTDTIPKFIGFRPGSSHPEWEIDGITLTVRAFFYSDKENTLSLDVIRICTTAEIDPKKSEPLQTSYLTLSNETIFQCMGKNDIEIAEICSSAGLVNKKDITLVRMASAAWMFVLKHNKQGKSFGEIIVYLNKMLGVKDRDEIMCIGMFKRAYDSNSTVEVISP